MNVIIIGAGPAGSIAAKRIKANDPGIDVTLFDSGTAGLYAKIRLPEYLSGKIDAAKLTITSAGQFEKLGIHTRFGETVSKISPKAKTLKTNSGETLGYDKLIIASGANASIPPIPGCTDSPRVLTLRKKEDADALIELSKNSQSALVLGGGLLGLEAAWALKERGLGITIIECMERLLPRQLNEKESALLYDEFTSLGFEILLNASLRDVGTFPNGIKASVNQGIELNADFMLVSAGIRSETSLAGMAGLEVRRGIVVNNHLRTSSPDIYAIGDCAELNGNVAGLWVAAKDQGEALGDLLCGKRDAFVEPSYVPQLKVTGINLDEIRNKAKKQ